MCWCGLVNGQKSYVTSALAPHGKLMHMVCRGRGLPGFTPYL